MSDIEMKIEELEKRVTELERQVQPVDIDKIMKTISQHLESEFVSIADGTVIG
ncbi:hypothetical protein UT300018_15640 [Clostridium faecium]